MCTRTCKRVFACMHLCVHVRARSCVECIRLPGTESAPTRTESAALAEDFGDRTRRVQQLLGTHRQGRLVVEVRVRGDRHVPDLFVVRHAARCVPLLHRSAGCSVWPATKATAGFAPQRLWTPVRCWVNARPMLSAGLGRRGRGAGQAWPARPASSENFFSGNTDIKEESKGARLGSMVTAGVAAGAMCEDGLVSRERYTTADGKSASVYRTHVWRHWPAFKNGLTLLTCSTLIFAVGPGLFAGALWACPRPLRLLLGAAYGAHLVLSHAQHSGSMMSRWWRRLDLHLAVMEYFGYRLLVADDVELSPERHYVIGTHPHGVYALGQLPFMCTSPNNPLHRLFPFLDKTVNTGASVVFYVPGVREMFLLVGHVVVSKRTIERWLRRKHSVGIVVGGEAEVLIHRYLDLDT